MQNFQKNVFIALGANLGARAETLNRALTLLDANQYVHVLKVSSVFETAPVGGPPGQPMYLNAAAALETSLEPGELLEVLLGIEHQLGRDRSKAERNLPRPVDLDVLFYGGEVIDQPHLIVPHPRLHEREFVLGPMNEIAPDFVHPVLKKTMGELLGVLKKC